VGASATDRTPQHASAPQHASTSKTGPAASPPHSGANASDASGPGGSKSANSNQNLDENEVDVPRPAHKVKASFKLGGSSKSVRRPARPPPRPKELMRVGTMIGAGRPFRRDQVIHSDSLPYPSAGYGKEALLLTGSLPFPDAGFGDQVMVPGFSFEAGEALRSGGFKSLQAHELHRHRQNAGKARLVLRSKGNGQTAHEEGKQRGD